MYTAKQKHNLYENNLIKPYLTENSLTGLVQIETGLGQSDTWLQIITSEVWFKFTEEPSHYKSPQSDQSKFAWFFPPPPTKTQTAHSAANQSSRSLQTTELSCLQKVCPCFCKLKKKKKKLGGDIPVNCGIKLFSCFKPSPRYTFHRKETMAPLCGQTVALQLILMGGVGG